jgi:hypothetical protein
MNKSAAGSKEIQPQVEQEMLWAALTKVKPSDNWIVGYFEPSFPAITRNPPMASPAIKRAPRN